MQYGPKAKDKGSEMESHISVNDVWLQSMRSYSVTVFPLISAGSQIKAPLYFWVYVIEVWWIILVKIIFDYFDFTGFVGVLGVGR